VKANSASDPADNCRLLHKSEEEMVIIGAAMRKLLHICYGVLKNQTPFDASPGQSHLSDGSLLAGSAEAQNSVPHAPMPPFSRAFAASLL